MSDYAGKHLHNYIVNRPEYKSGKIAQAMQQGFLELDKVMENDAFLKEQQAGTTVIALIIKDNILYSVS